jgi:tetratricopeptide (TPR) repeat protein
LNPATQYNNLKRQYEKGKKGPDFLLALINAAQQANDSEFTPVVMNAYLTTQKDLLTAENLKFISIATSKTTDPGYSILRNHGEKVDSVAGKGKSAEIIKTVVFDEIVLPYLRVGGVKMNYGGGMVDYTGELNKNVDWAVIKAKLNTQYPNLSDEIIMSAKPMYFRWQDNWPAFSEAVSAYASKYGNGLNNNVINSYAWDIFLFSNDVKCMEAALAWSKGTLSGENDKNIMYLYTYGNLLYKSGKKEQAIATIEDAIKYSGEVNGQLTTLVGKMKNGEKTW